MSQKSANDHCFVDIDQETVSRQAVHEMAQHANGPFKTIIGMKDLMVAKIISKGSQKTLNVFPGAMITELGHQKCSEETPHDGSTFASLTNALHSANLPGFRSVIESESSL